MLLKHEVVLKIDHIEVPGKSVPREFVEQMSPYRITERYVTDPVIGPAMAKLTRVGIADGKVVLARIPGEIPADEIGEGAGGRGEPAVFRDTRHRRLRVSCFSPGLMIFIGLRAKSDGP